MKRNATFPRILQCALVAESVLLSSLAAEEVIHSSDLASGSRGVVFQASVGEKFASVKCGGDVDGDGFGDILLVVQDECSENQFDNAAILVYGRAELVGLHRLGCQSFPGSATFRVKEDSSILTLVEPFPAGDLDADGKSDFFVAVEQRGEGGRLVERIYLIYGGTRIEGEHFVNEVGNSLAGIVFYSSDPLDGCIREDSSIANIGDFDGDGTNDLAIGFWVSTVQGRSKAGKVYVVLQVEKLDVSVDLSQIGVSLPGVQIEGGGNPDDGGVFAGEGLGHTVRGVGDFDDDGFADIEVASSRSLLEQKGKGRHYLVRGSLNPSPLISVADFPNRLDTDAVSLILGPVESGSQMTSSAVGDVDGDGKADILLGAAPLSNDPFFVAKPGIVYLVHGFLERPRLFEVVGLPLEGRVKYIEYESNSLFGWSLAAAGDLNSDGTPDFLVGAPAASPDGNIKAGEAYAIYGSRDRVPEVRLAEGFGGIRVLGEAARSKFGNRVSSAGDFNGDGNLDFVVAAPKVRDTTDDGEYTRYYLIYGTGGKPQPLRLLGVEPGWGPLKGGTTIEIRGTGFRGSPRVTIGGAGAESVEVVSEFKLRVVTPAGAIEGFADVEITADGQTQRMPDGFEYTANFPPIDVGRLGPSGLILEGRDRTSFGAKGRVTFGDLTGDGFDEAAVSNQPGTRIEVGIVKGGVDLPERLAAFTPSPRVTVVRGPEDPTGTVRVTRVSVLGDVNGDGLKDLGISRRESFAYILFGRRDLAEEIDLDTAVGSDQAVFILPGRSPTGNFTMVAMGDLTGDGLGDFAVGFSEELTDNGQNLQLEGEIAFVKGRTDWPRDFDLADLKNVFSRIRGSRAGQRLTTIMVPAGDVNGDGVQDLLVDGGQGANDLFMDHFAFVIYGKRDLPAEADVETYVAGGGGVKIQPPRPYTFGSQFNLFDLAGPGDVNGDGFADVLVGQRGGGIETQGVTYLLFGGPKLSGHVIVNDKPAEPDGIVRIFGEASIRLAGNVEAAGDFDADGFKDFLIGEGNILDPNGKAGNVFLMLGRNQFPDRIELAKIGGRGIKIKSRSARWAIGRNVGPFGDMNGDGKSDFALGEIYRPATPEDLGPEESYLNVVYGPTGSRRFIRGDANEDTVVDLSDAVSILGHLFLGAAAPCDRRPLDADDNATLEITDALYLLGFLFLGQPPPPAPFPNLGIDATPDELGCRF